MLKRLALFLVLLTFAAATAGCGDTWRGAKRDTAENLEATGRALERAGEKIKN